MALAFPVPRLLPTTMVALALLLAAKSVGLVRAAAPAAPAAASAAASSAVPDVRSTPPAAPARAGHAAAEQPAAAHAPPPTPTAAPTGTAEPPVSEAERGLLQDLRRRRGELDQREAALVEREAVAGAAARRLAERLDELAALQKQLQALEAARREREQASWGGLVRVYESMKPRDAAAIMNDLDLPILAAVVDRMKEGKAAAVLAAMLPDRARTLTAELSRQRVVANQGPGATAPAPVTAPTGAPAAPVPDAH